MLDPLILLPLFANAFLPLLILLSLRTAGDLLGPDAEEDVVLWRNMRQAGVRARTSTSTFSGTYFQVDCACGLFLVNTMA